MQRTAVAMVLVIAAPFAQGAPATRDRSEMTAVYRAGNVESFDPPSATAGTHWRMEA